MQGEGARALETLESGPVIPEMMGEAAGVAGDVHLANGDLAAAREAYDRAVHELPRSSALWDDVARFREATAATIGARDPFDYATETDTANNASLALTSKQITGRQGQRTS